MGASQSWTAAEGDAIWWLREMDPDGGSTGFDVGPLPDQVYVLHPLTERVDGAEIHAGYERLGGDPFPGVVEDCLYVRWPVGSGPEPATRLLSWHDYAVRRRIPLVTDPQLPGFNNSLPGVLDDDMVISPVEGTIGEASIWNALMTILERHTPAGGEQMCTALYFPVGLQGHPQLDIPSVPDVLRGRVGDSRELFGRPGYIKTPQNLWPDDHSWVLHTDEDGWASAVSGSSALIEDVLRHPDLEAVRPDDLFGQA